MTALRIGLSLVIYLGWVSALMAQDSLNIDLADFGGVTFETWTFNNSWDGHSAMVSMQTKQRVRNLSYLVVANGSNGSVVLAKGERTNLRANSFQMLTTQNTLVGEGRATFVACASYYNIDQDDDFLNIEFFGESALVAEGAEWAAAGQSYEYAAPIRARHGTGLSCETAMDQKYLDGLQQDRIRLPAPSADREVESSPNPANPTLVSVSTWLSYQGGHVFEGDISTEIDMALVEYRVAVTDAATPLGPMEWSGTVPFISRGSKFDMALGRGEIEKLLPPGAVSFGVCVSYLDVAKQRFVRERWIGIEDLQELEAFAGTSVPEQVFPDGDITLEYSSQQLACDGAGPGFSGTDNNAQTADSAGPQVATNDEAMELPSSAATGGSTAIESAQPKKTTEAPLSGCDILAGGPFAAFSANGFGVQFSSLEGYVDNAIAECASAHRVNPQEARFTYQLARSLIAKDRSDPQALALLQEAAELDSPPALYLLAGIYDHGMGVEADAEKAATLKLRASALGFPPPADRRNPGEQEDPVTSMPVAAAQLNVVRQPVTATVDEVSGLRAFIEENFPDAFTDGPFGPPQFDLRILDLDEDADGVDEIILGLVSGGYCGSAGCQWTVLRRGPEGSLVGIADMLAASVEVDSGFSDGVRQVMALTNYGKIPFDIAGKTSGAVDQRRQIGSAQALLSNDETFQGSCRDGHMWSGQAMAATGGSATYRGCGDGEYVLALECLAGSGDIFLTFNVRPDGYKIGDKVSGLVTVGNRHFPMPGDLQEDEMTGYTIRFRFDRHDGLLDALKSASRAKFDAADTHFSTHLSGSGKSIEAMLSSCPDTR